MITFCYRPSGWPEVPHEFTGDAVRILSVLTPDQVRISRADGMEFRWSQDTVSDNALAYMARELNRRLALATSAPFEHP